MAHAELNGVSHGFSHRMRDQRSLLNFAVLLFVAALTAVFVLNKADKAVVEVQALANTPVYLGARELIDTSTSSVSLAAGWKTYRNEKYGFEVKYPLDWIIQECPPNYVEFNIRKREGFRCGADSPDYPTMQMKVDAESKVGIEYYLRSMRISLDNISESSMTVSGHQAAKFIGIPNSSIGAEPLPGKVVTVLLEKSNIIFMLSSFEPYSEFFDGILSTFKFIK